MFPTANRRIAAVTVARRYENPVHVVLERNGPHEVHLFLETQIAPERLKLQLVVHLTRQ